MLQTTKGCSSALSAFLHLRYETVEDCSKKTLYDSDIGTVYAVKLPVEGEESEEYVLKTYKVLFLQISPLFCHVFSLWLYMECPCIHFQP